MSMIVSLGAHGRLGRGGGGVADRADQPRLVLLGARAAVPELGHGHVLPGHVAMIGLDGASARPEGKARGNCFWAAISIGWTQPYL